MEVRIVSWNSQGYKADLFGKLLKENVCALCVQEAGVFEMPEAAEQVVEGVFHFVRPWGRNEYEVFYWPVDAKNPRCSMAIIVPAGLAKGCQIHFLEKFARPVISVKLCPGFWVSTTHSESSHRGRVQAAECIEYLGLKGYHGLCVGDFNCTPDDLQGYNVIASDAPTQLSGDTLDFGCAVSYNTSKIEADVLDNPGSDHWPVCFDMELKTISW